MSAELFSLAAHGRPWQATPRFTSDQRTILAAIIYEAVSGGAACNHLYEKYKERHDLVFTNGKDGPRMTFSKHNGESGPVYVYSRSNGDTFTTERFMRAVDFARQDIGEFGPQTRAENERRAAAIFARNRRASFHAIKGGRACQPG